MKSRSEWLKLAGKERKYGKSGKKRFLIHKNHHIKILNLESTLREKDSFLSEHVTTKTPQPIRIKMFTKLEPIDKKIYWKNPIEKQTENFDIKTLDKVATANNFGVEKKISLESRFKHLKDNSETFIKRYWKVPEYKSYSNLDMVNHPAFAQPKFTKNNPKIMLSNPITGISPKFGGINLSF
ncbi:hypothetical protein SteCoe_34795 [Stentor coeruleus]|uniref:Uncharacterized protein n=1 Tax=Stentor coeruleus TaxID=5963 RepID=A0A1R2ATT2_9CILI|nr:hypothetical protein SteCoe_34795 [Stentor coeruleus]